MAILAPCPNAALTDKVASLGSQGQENGYCDSKKGVLTYYAVLKPLKRSEWDQLSTNPKRGCIEGQREKKGRIILHDPMIYGGLKNAYEKNYV